MHEYLQYGVLSLPKQLFESLDYNWHLIGLEYNG